MKNQPRLKTFDLNWNFDLHCKTYKVHRYIQWLCLYYRKCINVYKFYLVYNPFKKSSKQSMTSVFDDNIISINYKYFAYGHGKIGDYLIYH